MEIKNNKDLLINELTNYIEFLSSQLPNLTLFALNHSYMVSDEVIQKGIEYRKQIKELRDKITFSS